MRTDMEIQQDVVAELKWDPSLRDDDVAVSVRDGVVTLAGFVAGFFANCASSMMTRSKWPGPNFALPSRRPRFNIRGSSKARGTRATCPPTGS